MPVSSDYAARTACRDHANICTKELRGSLRFMFYSECEGRRQYGCKFSHTIFNTKRVVRLGGGKQDFHVKLDYGYGFERYGTYEGWSDGWDVTVDGKEYRSHGNMEKTFDIPKALLLAEKRMGLKKAGDPDVPHVKSQSLCMAHYEGAGCQRSDCRYDHDLVDGTRIEKLARWKEQGMSPNFDFLSLECKAKGGVVKWKITMKPDAFKELNATDSFSRTIPPRPFNYESDNLLDVIKQMEQTVGLKVSSCLSPSFIM
ncbi:hypothetical protein F5I97DRAFT_1815357 [Phlebopus sp. FC_14]|nr:hypothetical protein F5I97DRAFT_1815357 [Phlebopus sp. FC_14]